MNAIKEAIELKKRLLEEKSKLNGCKRSFFRHELESPVHLDPKTRKISDSSEDVKASCANQSDQDPNVAVLKEECKLNRNEVIRRLRERRQPIRLFGESDFEVYQRLKRQEIHEPEEKGLGSDFKNAMDKVQQDYLQEMFQQNPGLLNRSNSGGDRNAADSSITKSSLEVNIKSDELRESEIATMRDELMTYVAERTSAYSKKNVSLKRLDEAMATLSDQVLLYLKHIFGVWGRELNARSKEEKQSFCGRKDSATYTQTVEYIKPLFKKLKNKDISHDILDSLVKIVALLLDRNYIKANDAYLELAIGNAPWPLGVTNHGIHTRTAQEKIHAKNVAHVLNDETQRKYIQAIKRLMTNCQRLYPTDPSRCVNYMGSG